MSELYYKLREYFENTPREQLDKDWEDVCKIIKDDLGYVTWCLSKMRGFRLLNIEKEYYEHAMFVNSLINIR